MAWLECFQHWYFNSKWEILRLPAVIFLMASFSKISTFWRKPSKIAFIAFPSHVGISSLKRSWKTGPWISKKWLVVKQIRINHLFATILMDNNYSIFQMDELAFMLSFSVRSNFDNNRESAKNRRSNYHLRTILNTI